MTQINNGNHRGGKIFESWCEQTASRVRAQINRQNIRVGLHIASDSEETYTHVTDGILKISAGRDFGYEFYYLEIYQDYGQFDITRRSLSEVEGLIWEKGIFMKMSKSHIIKERDQVDTQRNNDVVYTHPPIIKKMILPQCFFQSYIQDQKIYFLQSDTHLRTAMLKFQSEFQTNNCWRFICWVIKRELNTESDPIRALYLPNQKNLSFILGNWTWMKPSVFDDIKNNSDRFVKALAEVMEKCIEVGDDGNLETAHEVMEKLFYTEDKDLIEVFFKNDLCFRTLIWSISRKRGKDLLSCYWDPIVPLPVDTYCQLKQIILNDKLHVIPIPVRSAICFVHRITFFREYVLEIRANLPFEQKIVEITKEYSNNLIKYFTDENVMKDILGYDDSRWGLWKSNMVLGNQDRMESKSQVLRGYLMDERAITERCNEQWERWSQRVMSQRALSQKAMSERDIRERKGSVSMDLQQEKVCTQNKEINNSEKKPSNLLENQLDHNSIEIRQEDELKKNKQKSHQQFIEIEDDSSSGECQIIQKHQKKSSTIPLQQNSPGISLQNNQICIQISSINLQSNAINLEEDQQPLPQQNSMHLQSLGNHITTQIQTKPDSSNKLELSVEELESKLERQRQIWVSEQLYNARSHLVKSFKPLLFWMILTFAKSLQQTQSKSAQQAQFKQQVASALFSSQLLKYIFKGLNEELIEREKIKEDHHKMKEESHSKALMKSFDNQKIVTNQLNPKNSLSSQLSHQQLLQEMPSCMTSYEMSCQMVKSELLIQMLITLGKYHHKKFINYLNSHSRKAMAFNSQSQSITFNSLNCRGMNIRKMLGEDRKKKRHDFINPYKVLALMYWRYQPEITNSAIKSMFPSLQMGCGQGYRKILFLVENLFPEVGNEQFVGIFMSQFVENCFYASIKYFTKTKIKQESTTQSVTQVNNRNQPNNNNLNSSQYLFAHRVELPFREARRRQLQLCMVLMRVLPCSQYCEMVRYYLLKGVLPTFGVVQNQQDSYNKDEKLLLMQFVSKILEIMEWTRKEREKHQHKQRLLMNINQDDQYSDFNIPPIVTNKPNDQHHYSIHSNSSNNPNNKPPVPSRQPQNPSPQLPKQELINLELAVYDLQKELVHQKLIMFFYMTLLKQLKRKKENCIVACGLDIMKRMKAWLFKQEPCLKNFNGSYINGNNSYGVSNGQYAHNQRMNGYGGNRIGGSLQSWNNPVSIHKSMISMPYQTNMNRQNRQNNFHRNHPNNYSNYPMVETQKLPPILSHMFSILQKQPSLLTQYIQHLVPYQKQLFMAFYINPHPIASSDSLSLSSQQQSSSVDYSQSNESSNEYDNAYYHRRFRQESSGHESEYSSQSEEDARRNHQLEGMLDEMYNRRQDDSSESQDQQEEKPQNNQEYEQSDENQENLQYLRSKDQDWEGNSDYVQEGDYLIPIPFLQGEEESSSSSSSNDSNSSSSNSQSSSSSDSSTPELHSVFQLNQHDQAIQNQNNNNQINQEIRSTFNRNKSTKPEKRKKSFVNYNKKQQSHPPFDKDKQSSESSSSDSDYKEQEQYSAKAIQQLFSLNEQKSKAKSKDYDQQRVDRLMSKLDAKTKPNLILVKNNNNNDNLNQQLFTFGHTFIFTKDTNANHHSQSTDNSAISNSQTNVPVSEANIGHNQNHSNGDNQSQQQETLSEVQCQQNEDKTQKEQQTDTSNGSHGQLVATLLVSNNLAPNQSIQITKDENSHPSYRTYFHPSTIQTNTTHQQKQSTDKQFHHTQLQTSLQKQTFAEQEMTLEAFTSFTPTAINPLHYYTLNQLSQEYKKKNNLKENIEERKTFNHQQELVNDAINQEKEENYLQSINHHQFKSRIIYKVVAPSSGNSLNNQHQTESRIELDQKESQFTQPTQLKLKQHKSLYPTTHLHQEQEQSKIEHLQPQI